MNKQQLEAKLEEAWSESGKLRIAIMSALGRDPYDWPPSDDVLIAELAVLTTASTLTTTPMDSIAPHVDDGAAAGEPNR